MEITNEIKAKMFAQYFGHLIKIGNSFTCTLVGIKGHNTITTGVSANNIWKYYKISACVLVLKPLSAMTDEDAIEIAKIYLHNDNDVDDLGFLECGKNIAYDLLTGIFQGNTIWMFQFLQSKGYDLPQYLLNGKTLQEAGLAIYE